LVRQTEKMESCNEKAVKGKRGREINPTMLLGPLMVREDDRLAVRVDH